MKNNLVIAFCSFRPEQYPEHVNIVRQQEYFICLQQLKRVLPANFDLLIIDNTTCDFAPLLDLVQREHHMFIEGNKGVGNIGVGELDMLIQAYNAKKLEGYEKIVYLTARRFLTCPYIFERTESLQKNALICNPDFVMLDGTFIESAKDGLYCDIFFAMKYNAMKAYIEFTDLNKMVTEKYGSEQNLYRFINQNSITYEWINWMGMLRNDWMRTGNPIDIRNFHIC